MGHLIVLCTVRVINTRPKCSPCIQQALTHSLFLTVTDILVSRQLVYVHSCFHSFKNYLLSINRIPHFAIDYRDDPCVKMCRFLPLCNLQWRMQVDIRGGDFQEGHSIDWDLGEKQRTPEEKNSLGCFLTVFQCLHGTQRTLCTPESGGPNVLPKNFAAL